MNSYAFVASLLGTTVEFIEALTIILAVGMTKGWKSALLGMTGAVVVLAALVAIFGSSLVQLVNLSIFQLIIGILMLLFGIRWFRKAILRYSGLKALHFEDQAYEKEVKKQKESGTKKEGIDWFGFSTAFNGVFLEGLESIFIVLTFGLAAHSLSMAIYGSLVGLVIVVLLGISLRKPMTLIPENTIKFIVGLMLSSFGIFWVGEGIGVQWWYADTSILIITAIFLVVAFISVQLLSKSRKAIQNKKSVGGQA